MFMDLSAVSDTVLELILLRVPAKDLIGECTRVSPQWNRILSDDNDFWRQKMEQDGYKLDWPKLANLSTKSFQCIALKHCFGLNFIKDSWNLALRMETRRRRILTLDPRWADHYIGGFRSQIEVPPAFLDGQPEIPPGFVEQIPACLAIGTHPPFYKCIMIKLSKEGLTNEIMDNFRPTIIISEMIGNRRDCTSKYEMNCCLQAKRKDNPLQNRHQDQMWNFFQNHYMPEFRNEYRDQNGRWVRATIGLQFIQGQGENWHGVEHVFRNYPAGMRYLVLLIKASLIHQPPLGIYGLKLANCSVKALFEKNTE